MPLIRAVPNTYRGVTFRSTLEADWAATLDTLGVAWSYEPEAVTLPSGERYRPDFYLPGIATWLEVKGPHDERIGKTIELASAVACGPDCGTHEPFCPYGWEYQLVIVGRAPIAGYARWELVWPHGKGNARLQRCPTCRNWWWLNDVGAYGCRAHRRHCGGDDDLGSETYESAGLDEPTFLPARPDRHVFSMFGSGSISSIRLPFARAPRSDA